MPNEPFTVEETPPGGTRRRHRYEPINGTGHYTKIAEEFTGDGWREVGKAVVEDVVVQTTTDTVIV